MKAAIREYVTINYREPFLVVLFCPTKNFIGRFCGNQKARVRWAGMAESPEEFFRSNAVPAEFKFQDPSHLRGVDASRLWDHWYSRQAAGHIALKFTGCDPRDERELSVGPSETSSVDNDGDSPAAVPKAKDYIARSNATDVPTFAPKRMQSQ
jgi:hypothetical protein